jgi:hypothetical protein
MNLTQPPWLYGGKIGTTDAIRRVVRVLEPLINGCIIASYQYDDVMSLSKYKKNYDLKCLLSEFEFKVEEIFP